MAGAQDAEGTPEVTHEYRMARTTFVILAEPAELLQSFHCSKG